VTQVAEEARDFERQATGVLGENATALLAALRRLPDHTSPEG